MNLLEVKFAEDGFFLALSVVYRKACQEGALHFGSGLME